MPTKVTGYTVSTMLPCIWVTHTQIKYCLLGFIQNTLLTVEWYYSCCCVGVALDVCVCVCVLG